MKYIIHKNGGRPTKINLSSGLFLVPRLRLDRPSSGTDKIAKQKNKKAKGKLR